MFSLDGRNNKKNILQNQLVLVRPGWAAAQNFPGNRTCGRPCRSDPRAAPSPSPSAPAAPSSSWPPPSPPCPSPPAAGPVGRASPGVSSRPLPSPAEPSSGFSAAPPRRGVGARLPVDAAAVRRGEGGKRGEEVHKGRLGLIPLVSFRLFKT